MIDLAGFAAAVGEEGPVTIAGLGTRGGAVTGVRAVQAPAGIDWVQADEMTVCCGAGTTLDDLTAALAEVGQRTVLPPGGTVGGALAVGWSGIRRLGDGPMRDALLQARYVSADGEVVKAGGPTVKNVSGFDLCRLLVGSRGTLGFLGEVILRTRPLPLCSQWYVVNAPDPFPLFTALYRPVTVLADGRSTWVLLEGHPGDVEEMAARHHLEPCAAPEVPDGARRMVTPSQVGDVLRRLVPGSYLVEVGIGAVHLADAAALGPHPGAVAGVAEIERRVKTQFDPVHRLNPGVRVGIES